MWKNAKSSAQKMAIIGELIPISGNDYLDAIIHFSGDDDHTVEKAAVEKLKTQSANKLIGKIEKNMQAKIVFNLLNISIEERHYRIIAKILNNNKVEPEWIERIFFHSDENLWNTLLSNREFVAVAYHSTEKVEDFLSKLSKTLLHKFKEETTYLSEEDKIIKPSVEQEVSKEILEDEQVVDFEEDHVEFEVPDFLISETAFEGLAPDEMAEQRQNITQLINNMNVGDKIKVASTGNLEVRKMLIKNPMKQVYMAVIKNPRITDKEVLGVVSSSASPVDMISYVSEKKEYTKNYMVRFNLTLNPKTALRISMRFLSTLRKEDLKKIYSSKGITQALKNAARKRHMKMSQ